MKNDYAKSSLDIITICEKALLSISKCRTYDPLSFSGYIKCAPNDSDLDKVNKALYEIAEYKKLRNY
jgi:hypothetical protein